MQSVFEIGNGGFEAIEVVFAIANGIGCGHVCVHVCGYSIYIAPTVNLNGKV